MIDEELIKKKMVEAGEDGDAQLCAGLTELLRQMRDFNECLEAIRNGAEGHA